MTDTLYNGDLALAAYADLQLGPSDTPTNRAALIRAGMAATQADEFAIRFPTVIAQYNDTTAEGGTNTSFSAVVFKSSTGEVTLAIRGTLEPRDFQTDADIFTLGAAYDQIVAMTNWWLRVSGSAGQVVQQYRLATYPPDAVPTGAVVIRPGAESTLVLESGPSVIAAGGAVANAIALDQNHRVDVTGHSLGGHLAMAFSSIFAAQTDRTTVYNAPGFTNSVVNQGFFAKLGGTIPTSASITNVAADEALIGAGPLNLAAGLHSRPGEQINIAIENQFDPNEPLPFVSRNHSMVTLADSIAVYKLLADLSPQLSTADYKTILNRAAQIGSGSYEAVVDALELLFKVNGTPLEVGNGAAAREALYQAIYGLRKPANSSYDSVIGLLQILPTPDSAAALRTGAADPTDGLAYRYTLNALAPFVALGDALGTVYAAHNTAGELNLYNAQGRTGQLTDQWLTDRAAFLERKLYITGLNLDKFYQDSSQQAPDARGRAYQLEGKDFEDRASGFVATTGSNRTALQHYIFGTNEADSIVGSDQEDHLYGGAGSDFLDGGASADWLEGGRGLDAYRFRPGDFADTILDTDGVGVVIRAGTLVALGVKTSETQWVLGSTTFTKNGGDLEITFADNAADRITIKDFNFTTAETARYFGIALRAAPSAAQNEARTFLGDKQDYDSNVSQPGVQTQTDAFGNTIRADGQGGRPDLDEPNRADTFLGSSANEVEKFQTGGGDDVAYGDGPNGATSLLGGRDLIETGAGRDIVVAGAGDDWVEGGIEGDLLFGNAGDDVIYGNTSGAQTLTIQ